MIRYVFVHGFPSLRVKGETPEVVIGVSSVVSDRNGRYGSDSGTYMGRGCIGSETEVLPTLQVHGNHRGREVATVGVEVDGEIRVSSGCG